MVNTEEMLKAACINRDAAESMRRSAGEMEQAVHRLTMAFEPGYGGNGSRLIELLESQPTPDISPDQYHAGVAKLWKALRLTSVQDEDVFTLAARKIDEMREALGVVAYQGIERAAACESKVQWEHLARTCISVAAGAVQ